MAVVGSPGIAPSDPLALTVFARTGAPLLYISRPRIRFPDVYLQTSAQAPRFYALRTVARGGVPPLGRHADPRAGGRPRAARVPRRRHVPRRHVRRRDDPDRALPLVRPRLAARTRRWSGS